MGGIARQIPAWASRLEPSVRHAAIVHAFGLMSFDLEEATSTP